jgi:hypothetical protein
MQCNSLSLNVHKRQLKGVLRQFLYIRTELVASRQSLVVSNSQI